MTKHELSPLPCLASVVQTPNLCVHHPHDLVAAVRVSLGASCQVLERKIDALCLFLDPLRGGVFCRVDASQGGMASLDAIHAPSSQHSASRP